MTKQRQLPLTTVVLRGLMAAIGAHDANIEVSMPGDYTSTAIEEQARARAGASAQCAKRGWSKIYPHLAKTDATYAKRTRSSDVERQIASEIADDKRAAKRCLAVADSLQCSSLEGHTGVHTYPRLRPRVRVR